MRNAAHVLAPALLAGALLAIGCGHGRMVPSNAADVVSGAPESAFAEDNGVRVAANGDDWSGRPADLTDRLTPVKVRIVNHSGKPIRILYQQFELQGAHHHAYHPLPLAPIDHGRLVARDGTVRPIFAAASFYVAPGYHDLYPSLPAWPNRLPRDGAFYERQYARWNGDLPSSEMQRMALPEGVLDDGGQIAGYLYFENATTREDGVVFKAELDDGQAGAPVASIDIPFRIE